MANISREDDRKDFELRRRNGGNRPHGRTFQRKSHEQEVAEAEQRAADALAALRAFNRNPSNFDKGQR